MTRAEQYRRHNDAIARRIADNFAGDSVGWPEYRPLADRPKRKPHIPGPRVDLPGQLELPQTEPRSAELAKRKALEPIKADKPQQPCDIGLFSDDAQQLDLIR